MLHYLNAHILHLCPLISFVLGPICLCLFTHPYLFCFFFFFLLLMAELQMSWLKCIQLELNLHGVFLDCSEQQSKE